ncbi:hypothetical protein AB0D10_44010 [Kitasatospora sp. NPDC048545]|uniref:hypothetical protein n=1 Tax=Kitasatospora sp. NPDC048545 TaxID=3157208 RepID=UPI0033F1A0E5
MPEHSTTVRDVAALKVARVGRVEKSDDPLRPFRIVDADGTEVAAVSEFLHHMLADDARPTSLRSYAYELLAWVRFLHAVDVPWDLASRVEARDFALWLKTTKKPPRQRRPDAPAPGSVNPVTGKAAPGENYAVRTSTPVRLRDLVLVACGRGLCWWVPGLRFVSVGARRPATSCTGWAGQSRPG